MRPIPSLNPESSALTVGMVNPDEQSDDGRHEQNEQESFTQHSQSECDNDAVNNDNSFDAPLNQTVNSVPIETNIEYDDGSNDMPQLEESNATDNQRKQNEFVISDNHSENRENVDETESKNKLPEVDIDDRCFCDFTFV